VRKPVLTFKFMFSISNAFSAILRNSVTVIWIQYLFWSHSGTTKAGMRVLNIWNQTGEKSWSWYKAYFTILNFKNVLMAAFSLHSVSDVRSDNYHIYLEGIWAPHPIKIFSSYQSFPCWLKNSFTNLLYIHRHGRCGARWNISDVYVP
jgi:hypothetical protein